jgi:hypothetical protein
VLNEARVSPPEVKQSVYAEIIRAGFELLPKATDEGTIDLTFYNKDEGYDRQWSFVLQRRGGSNVDDSRTMSWTTQKSKPHEPVRVNTWLPGSPAPVELPGSSFPVDAQLPRGLTKADIDQVLKEAQVAPADMRQRVYAEIVNAGLGLLAEATDKDTIRLIFYHGDAGKGREWYFQVQRLGGAFMNVEDSRSVIWTTLKP